MEVTSQVDSIGVLLNALGNFESFLKWNLF